MYDIHKMLLPVDQNDLEEISNYQYRQHKQSIQLQQDSKIQIEKLTQ